MSCVCALVDDNLGDLKRSNGLQKFDLRRHFVPPTSKGKLALKLGFTVVGKRPLQDDVENRLKTETTLVRAVFATTQSSFEVLDTGVVPIVANLGGSGDIVHLEVTVQGDSYD